MISSFRRWSSRALAPAAALALLALAASAQTLKLATLVPEGSVWDKSMRELGAAVQQATAGRVKFLIYPGGVAGDEPDVLRKMRIGQLQGGLFSASGLGDIDPAFYLFQVPLLLETDAEVELILSRMRTTLSQRLAAKGCVLVQWSNVGWLRFFGSKPITSFDDFKRRKQFVWGTDGRLASWYQQLGLTPVSLSGGDVFTGLETGLIECLPATPLAALSLQWFRPAPHMLDHRFAPLLGGLVLTQASWAKLSADDQATFLRLAQASEEQLFAQIPELEREALAEMKKRGLEVVTEPASDAEKWLALGRSFQELFRTHTVPPEIFDQAKALLEEHRSSR
ncbi:MAG TPA: TRAP transporter substrate-binding protein DctP [Planctomycetota bacterium]